MSEQEQPPVGAAMWGGRRLLRGERDLAAVPDDPTPDERVVSLADAAALVLLGVGTALAPLGVAFAAGPGWGIAVFGALCFALGILVGIGGSR